MVGRCLFSVSFLLPWLPGWTEKWCRIPWRAVWAVVMNIVLCRASSQGGKWRGFPKPQPRVPGNPPQSNLISTPCLSLSWPYHTTERTKGGREMHSCTASRLGYTSASAAPHTTCALANQLYNKLRRFLSCSILHGNRRQQDKNENDRVAGKRGWTGRWRERQTASRGGEKSIMKQPTLLH